MRYALLILILSTALAACREDKTPSFDDIDAPVSDARSDRSTQEDDSTGIPTDCIDHSDCSRDELCLDGECVDYDDAIDDCFDDSDCPDGWICIDEDYCEEE